MNGWTPLLWFVLSLLGLVILSRWVNRLVQGVAWLLFGDERAVYLATYFVFLPGIVLHELSHWVMAWLLRMHPRQLSLWPKVRGQRVEMGSLRVNSGGTVRDSLTGLAPLLVGTLVILLVSHRIFGAAGLLQAWSDGGFAAVWRGFWRTFAVANAGLWIYAIFAVSNAMLPSAPDRQPLISLLLYAAIVGLVAYLLAGPSWRALAPEITERVVRGLRTLTTGFVFTIALDLLVALSLLAVQLLIATLRRSRKGVV